MRDQLRTVLIVTEGLTEKKYLDHLRKRNAGYVVHVIESPRKSAADVFRHCCKEVSNRGLNLKDFDVAYCVIDVDFNSKEKILKILESAAKKRIRIVISNPCYEVFYICHFKKDPPVFSTPKEAKEFLRELIPDYSESVDYWDRLSEGREDAIQRTDLPVKDVPLTLGLASCSNVGRLFTEMESLEETIRGNDAIR